MASSVVSRRYGLVVAGALCYTSLTFVWFSLPAYLATIIAEVGLSGTEAGLLAGAVPLTYIPIALFSGLAVDRIGPARSLAVGLVVTGIAQVVRSVAGGFPTLLAATLLLGVGATAITFGLPKLVSVLFPPDETGLPSSVYMVGAAVGTASAFGLGRPVVGPLLGGWRPLFFWSGVAALGYAVVWLAVVRIVPIGGEDGTANGDRERASTSVRTDLRRVLSHRDLRLMVVLGIVYLALVHGLQGWLPTMLEARGLSADRAGQTTTLLVGAKVVGVLAIPTLADRIDARRGAVIGCGGLAAVGVAGVIAGGATAVAALGIVIAGLGVGGLSPLIRAIPPNLDGIGPELTGVAVGLVFAVGEIGGFLGPVLVGTLHDLTGSYVPGFGVLVGGGVVAVIVGAALGDV
ncbi:MFS transporter [Halorientalis regularis]|uniref:Cyanate permease n=1 Tax=Halorientalis regularis TaxID=660518 RepID=A0A1G7PX38_9EURY|nr:MFS transporter [Halorientalis regularis]SDF90811.1 Cyanate permease [Halorientalis regularis]